MLRKTTLIASTVLALSTAPLLADGHAVVYDANNTLAGKTDEVTTIDMAGGGMVFTNDGAMLGVIEDFDIDSQNRAEVIIDLAAETKFLGDRLILSTDPENVTVANGSIAVNATENELFAQSNNGGSQKYIRVDF